MIKNTYIFIFVFVASFVLAQKDSLPRKNFNHFAGIDFGYTSYDKLIGFKGETNINYVVNPYFFCAKIQLGIAPGTNFGTLKKGFISIGFSTRTNNFLSWHFLTGIGTISPSNTYDIKEPQHVKYTFYMSSVFLESGFYIRPVKSKRIIIGLNSIVHRINVDDGGKYAPISGKPTLNINLSINIKLNK